jgi:hypothetical protein
MASNRRFDPVQDGQEERLRLLCQQAANEHDSQKLLELVREINKLIDTKRNGHSREKSDK